MGADSAVVVAVGGQAPKQPQPTDGLTHPLRMRLPPQACRGIPAAASIVGQQAWYRDGVGDSEERPDSWQKACGRRLAEVEDSGGGGEDLEGEVGKGQGAGGVQTGKERLQRRRQPRRCSQCPGGEEHNINSPSGPGLL